MTNKKTIEEQAELFIDIRDKYDGREMSAILDFAKWVDERELIKKKLNDK